MLRLLALASVLILVGCSSQQEAAETGIGSPETTPTTTVAEETPPTDPIVEDQPPPAPPPPDEVPASGPVEDVTPFTVVLVFETPEPARTQVEYGAPGRLGLWSAADPAPTRAHRVLLDGLSPGRRFDFRVLVDGATPQGGTFETSPLPNRSLRVGAEGQHLEVDGHPFFPILLIGQCPADYPESRALGVDVYVGREQHCQIDDEELVDGAQAVGALAVVHFEDGIPGRPGLLGYNLRDEPDSLGFPPEAVAAESAEAQAADPDHPTFITLSHSIHPDFEGRWSGAEREGIYRAYANAADVVGVDLYPYWTLCNGSYLPAVATVQKVLSDYAEGPTFQWIEAAAGNNTACTGVRAAPVSAEEMRAEVWMAVTNGAAGIGYFTHTWVNGHVAFDVTEDVRDAMRNTNDELKGLAAALVGEQLAVEVSAPDVDALGRARNGALYLFAVNKTALEQPVRFTLAAGGRTVRNWRTGESIQTDADGFSDTLPPLGSAIYVLPPLASSS